MGYTRYWDRTKKKIDEDFVEYVNEVLDDCKEKGIIIRDGYGEGDPIVTLNVISINGNAETDLDHETLYFDNKETGFNFCKTARKPYDYAVRKILRYAEEVGLIKNLSDDGENEEVISDFEYLNGRKERVW